jgi:hypothetical protein
MNREREEFLAELRQMQEERIIGLQRSGLEEEQTD